MEKSFSKFPFYKRAEAIALWPALALLALAIVLAAMGGPGFAETPAKRQPASVAGTASVIDADTLDIHGQRIRLVGVDASESKQKCRTAGKFTLCGAKAANALDQWIN